MKIGGRGEIRTHDTVARTTDLETGALKQSATHTTGCFTITYNRFDGWSKSPLWCRAVAAPLHEQRSLLCTARNKRQADFPPPQTVDACTLIRIILSTNASKF